MDHEHRPASPTDPDVLAFIPDVDAAPPASSGSLGNHPLGRLLSQATSAKLLLAAAAVLVVAAVVPFLFGKKDTAKPVAEGAPSWQPGPAPEKTAGGPTLLQPSKTPATAPEVTAPTTIPTTADLRGAVKPPAAGGPTPLFGDRTAPPLSPADDRLRTIPPPRNPPAAVGDYSPISDPRDARYEARRPAPVEERSYELPRSPVGAMRPMTLGEPGAATPDYRAAEPRDYAPGYRREATPDYRREMPQDYRHDTAADYRRPDGATADYRQEYVPDYRRAPAPDYRSEAPADYRSGAAPGLADRRITPPAGGAAPGVGQPGVARIEGIIDTPPARTSYDSARPGVY